MFWRRGPAAEDQPSSAEDGEPAGPPEKLASGDIVATPAAPGPAAGEAIGEAGGQAALASGLSRTRGGLVARLRSMVGASDDPAAWEEVEEALIGADVGAVLAGEIVARARARHEMAGPEAAVRTELAALLAPRPAGPWAPARTTPGAPSVVLIVGVNGTGKTTTIAKLAARERRRGQRVLLAGADTFR
ncbi:MAG: signal recognition particle receptor subunit alpha, partial [Candidatus Limnocylindrales bacterium]